MNEKYPRNLPDVIVVYGSIDNERGEESVSESLTSILKK